MEFLPMTSHPSILKQFCIVVFIFALMGCGNDDRFESSGGGGNAGVSDFSALNLNDLTVARSSGCSQSNSPYFSSSSFSSSFSSFSNSSLAGWKVEQGLSGEWELPCGRPSRSTFIVKGSDAPLYVEKRRFVKRLYFTSSSSHPGYFTDDKTYYEFLNSRPSRYATSSSSSSSSSSSRLSNSSNSSNSSSSSSSSYYVYHEDVTTGLYFDIYGKIQSSEKNFKLSIPTRRFKNLFTELVIDGESDGHIFFHDELGAKRSDIAPQVLKQNFEIVDKETGKRRVLLTSDCMVGGGFSQLDDCTSYFEPRSHITANGDGYWVKNRIHFEVGRGRHSKRSFSLWYYSSGTGQLSKVSDLTSAGKFIQEFDNGAISFSDDQGVHIYKDGESLGHVGGYGESTRLSLEEQGDTYWTYRGGWWRMTSEGVVFLSKDLDGCELSLRLGHLSFLECTFLEGGAAIDVIDSLAVTRIRLISGLDRSVGMSIDEKTGQALAYRLIEYGGADMFLLISADGKSFSSIASIPWGELEYARTKNLKPYEYVGDGREWRARDPETGDVKVLFVTPPGLDLYYVKEVMGSIVFKTRSGAEKWYVFQQGQLRELSLNGFGDQCMWDSSIGSVWSDDGYVYIISKGCYGGDSTSRYLHKRKFTLQ